MNTDKYVSYIRFTPVFAFLIVFLLFSSFLVFASEENMSIKRYGMFIGSNYGGTDRVRLQYADSDAYAVASILMEMGGIGNDEALLLIDPTLETVTSGFDDVRYSI